MSCEIKTFAKIEDLSQVQEIFGFSQDENWLNAMYFALSPSGEILVFAHGSKIVLLSSIWDNNLQINRYTITWKGELENQNDIITSIICLPIIGTNSQNPTDWTCIVVGLSSGNTIFYADSGMELFSRQWHNESVLVIKAQSGKHIHEELHIIFLSCVCIIQGIQLIQVLKNIKHQLSAVNSRTDKLDINQLLDSIPQRKWSYGGKNLTINDTVIVGPQKTCSYDHLLTASMEGGFYAKYRSAPIQNSLLLSVGVKPYVGFHYAKEGFIPPVLSDVARAVAGKIKSSLLTWISGTPQQQQIKEPTPIAQLPADPMTLRFGLCDVQRSGLNICLSPGDYRLAAVTDNLGRIILIDCAKGIAIRVWKGNRDAQCCFVRVPEKISNKSDKSNRRYGLFLVIFAVRRSCIEIWALERGPKIAAFIANKTGQLIYNSHSLMGITGGGGGGSSTRHIRYPMNNCIFLDPSEKLLKEIIIPFHCSIISDENSKTAKDLHLLRRIKLCVKSGDDGTDEQIRNEIYESCKGLQTDEIRIQCLEILLKNHKIKPFIINAALIGINEQIISDENVGIGDGDGDTLHSSDLYSVNDELMKTCPDDGRDITQILHRRQLKTMIKNYKKLVDFYMYCDQDHGKDSDVDILNNKIVNDSKEKINLSENELENLQKMIDLSLIEKKSTGDQHQHQQQQVTFDKKLKLNHFIEYLAAFDCTTIDDIQLREDKYNEYGIIGEDIFSSFLLSERDISEFFKATLSSGICSEDFMTLFLYYWLGKPFAYENVDELIKDLNRFAVILNQLCLLASEKLHHEYNEICIWWQNIRELLHESSSALMGLLAAIICRNQSMKKSLKRITNLTSSNNGSTSSSSASSLSNEGDDVENWEQVSQESAQWSLLIGKLDDIAVLDMILSSVEKCEKPTILKCLQYEKPNISLKSIILGGKGIIAELVAKWIAATGINPKLILEKEILDNIENTSNDTNKSNESVTDGSTINESAASGNSSMTSSDENLIFKKHFHILHQHFPFSLQSGVLLTQLTWLYMCHWSKNMSELKLLESALNCLETFKQIDYSLKHGLCIMIWNAHLKIPLESIRKLINKSGRLPKEKFCLQDVGLSDQLIPDFLENCIKFMDHFIESGVEYNNLDSKLVQLRYEELLIDGPIPLSILTLQKQRPGNPILLNVHKQLIELLFMIGSLNVKYVKPIQNLFDEPTNEIFFSTDINLLQLEYPLPKPHIVLQRRRIEFLSIVITSTMDLILEDLQSVYLHNHILWMDRIFHIANKWELDTSHLRNHQIVELYSHNWDTYAEDLLEEVLDTENVGKLLLKVAGRRINLYVQNKPTAFLQVLSVGSLITQYLDNLRDSDDGKYQHLQSKDISLEKLINLAANVFKCLSEKDSNSLRIAGQLHDACHLLKINNL